jgi:hypothetical protein
MKSVHQVACHTDVTSSKRANRGVHRSKGPNVIGNRPAAPMVTEDQSMYRRVRLTARLGRSNGT